jgi:hypothetical protein
MNTRTKLIITVIASIQLVVTAGILFLPQILSSIPTRYQLVLEDNVSALEPVFVAIKTPLPDSIPIPAGALANNNATLPALDFGSSEALATATPIPPTQTPTIQPSPTSATVNEIEATATTIVEPATETPIPPTATAEIVATPTAVPLFTTLDNVNITRQNFNNCGPANLSIVLNYWGDTTTQLEASSYLKPNPEDRNVSPWQLSDYVNENTPLRSTVHSGGNIDILKNLIAAGFPVIIEKGYVPNANEGWLGHYLTVFGYDENTRTFRSHDTYIGPFDNSGRVDSYEEIEKGWQMFNYTFFVIYRPEQENEVNAILGETLLDTELMWQNAALIAEAQIEADAENAFAWFNLGTSLTRLGENTGESRYYQQGASAFDQAFVLGVPPRVVWYQFRPYIAYMKTERYQDMLDLANSTLETTGGRNVEETYLYQGHALAFLGDINGARAAYQKGLELNRNAYQIQWALDSIQ